MYGVGHSCAHFIDKDTKVKALETAGVARAQEHTDFCLKLWPLGKLGFILSESDPESLSQLPASIGPLLLTLFKPGRKEELSAGSRVS